jgi:predicted dehydrogenase
VLGEAGGGFDLVVVATPLDELRGACVEAVRCGNKNVLVEKPGALYSADLEAWARWIGEDVRVRVGYNRLMYPSLWKLKDLIAENGERVTSCFYTFTEWVHTIDFENNKADCYERWGVSNSLHVISMAHWLIGMPAELSAVRSGGLSWHEAGSQFAGSGLTEDGVVFSYHADWGSAGRWGVQVMTDSCAYRLIPLEKLFRCEKGSVEWKAVEFDCAFADCKMGVAEELAVMLLPELEEDIALVTVEDAMRFTKVAEEIFGYSCARSGVGV